jgi:hypothetical protein
VNLALMVIRLLSLRLFMMMLLVAKVRIKSGKSTFFSFFIWIGNK